MRRRSARSIVRAVTTALFVSSLAALALPNAAGSPFPPLPLPDDRGLLGNLSGAELTPGASGVLSLRVGDPLPSGLTAVVVTLDLYAFNAFPGNATSSVPVSASPTLSNGSASGAEVNLSIGRLSPGEVSAPVTVDVATSATTAPGTYAVRTGLQFVANGTSYRLLSRGWFSTSTWLAATAEANGSLTLNLSTLGVSGVTPETSVLVESTGISYVVWGVFAAAVLVLGAGAYLYLRPPKSSAGARTEADPAQAPTAFGKRRTRDGD